MPRSLELACPTVFPLFLGLDRRFQTHVGQRRPYTEPVHQSRQSGRGILERRGHPSIAIVPMFQFLPLLLLCGNVCRNIVKEEESLNQCSIIEREVCSVDSSRRALRDLGSLSFLKLSSPLRYIPSIDRLGRPSASSPHLHRDLDNRYLIFL